jgi:hypothetical protein
MRAGFIQTRPAKAIPQGTNIMPAGGFFPETKALSRTNRA